MDKKRKEVKMKAEMKKVVIIYVPVLHKGYVDFLEKYHKQGFEIWLLHENVADFLPNFKKYMERDVRRLPTVKIFGMLTSYLGFNVWQPRGSSIIEEIAPYDEIVMPDEDVSREFIDVLVKDEKQRRKIKLVPIILRFDKTYASKSFTVDTAIPITKEEFRKDHMKNPFDFDSLIMRNTKELAGKSKDWWRQVAVTVVTSDGKHHIGAYNKHKPDDDIHNIMGDVASNRDAGKNIEMTTALHAEASVIANAAKDGVKLDGASMYVTTFPCAGCSRIIAETGIKNLYYEEGYSNLEGKEVLENAGVKIFRISTKEDEQTVEKAVEGKNE